MEVEGMKIPQLGMSKSDFRKKLNDTFKASGLLDGVKSQIRSSLIESLKRSSKGTLLGSTKLRDTRAKESSSLALMMCNCLIVDHLKRNGFDYTLSVFEPESLHTGNKDFSIDDLLTLLCVSKDSKLYQAMVECYKDKECHSFLWTLLNEIVALKSMKNDNGTQTDAIDEGSSVFVKANNTSLTGQRETESPVNVEQALITFQQKQEERKKAEFQRELERFKNKELAMMKLEERENCYKEIETAKAQMHKEIQKMSLLYLEKERRLRCECQEEKDMLERDLFMKRQSILDDMNKLRIRENEVLSLEKKVAFEEKRVIDGFEKQRANEASVIDVRTKERSVLNSDLTPRNSHLVHKETPLSTESVHQQMQIPSSNAYDLLVSEFQQKNRIVNELTAALEISKKDVADLTTKCAILSASQDKINEYELVIAELRGELDELQVHNKLLLQQNINYRDQSAGNPGQSKQCGTHKKTANKASQTVAIVTDHVTALKSKQEHLLQHNKILGTRLNAEVMKNQELTRLYEDQSLHLREMMREVNDLQNVIKSQQALASLPTVPNNYKVHSNQAPAVEALPPSRPIQVHPIDDSGSSPDLSYSKKRLINESRQAIDNLDQEAIELERQYQMFSNRHGGEKKHNRLNNMLSPINRSGSAVHRIDDFSWRTNGAYLKHLLTRDGTEMASSAQSNASTSPINDRSASPPSRLSDIAPVSTRSSSHPLSSTHVPATVSTDRAFSGPIASLSSVKPFQSASAGLPSSMSNQESQSGTLHFSDLHQNMPANSVDTTQHQPSLVPQKSISFAQSVDSNTLLNQSSVPQREFTSNLTDPTCYSLTQEHLLDSASSVIPSITESGREDPAVIGKRNASKPQQRRLTPLSEKAEDDSSSGMRMTQSNQSKPPSGATTTSKGAGAPPTNPTSSDHGTSQWGSVPSGQPISQSFDSVATASVDSQGLREAPLIIDESSLVAPSIPTLDSLWRKENTTVKNQPVTTVVQANDQNETVAHNALTEYLAMMKQQNDNEAEAEESGNDRQAGEEILPSQEEIQDPALSSQSKNTSPTTSLKEVGLSGEDDFSW